MQVHERDLLSSFKHQVETQHLLVQYIAGELSPYLRMRSRLLGGGVLTTKNQKPIASPSRLGE